MKHLFIWGLVFALAISIVSTFAEDTVYVSTPSYSSSYSSTSSTAKSYSSSYSASKPAMTKERAESLKGTGYKGTRPNSWAESHELKCAQIKCDVCGMHTDNGYNSACDSCRAKGYN